MMATPKPGISKDSKKAGLADNRKPAARNDVELARQIIARRSEPRVFNLIREHPCINPSALAKMRPPSSYFAEERPVGFAIQLPHIRWQPGSGVRSALPGG